MPAALFPCDGFGHDRFGRSRNPSGSGFPKDEAADSCGTTPIKPVSQVSSERSLVRIQQLTPPAHIDQSDFNQGLRGPGSGETKLTGVQLPKKLGLRCNWSQLLPKDLKENCQPCPDSKVWTCFLLLWLGRTRVRASTGEESSLMVPAGAGLHSCDSDFASMASTNPPVADSRFCS